MAAEGVNGQLGARKVLLLFMTASLGWKEEAQVRMVGGWGVCGGSVLLEPL